MNGIVTLRTCPDCDVQHWDCSTDVCHPCSMARNCRLTLAWSLHLNHLDLDGVEAEEKPDGTISVRAWKTITLPLNPESQYALAE